jgi:hypothetical protein
MLIIAIYIISLLNYKFKINLIKFINNIYFTYNIYILNKCITFIIYYNKSSL